MKPWLPLAAAFFLPLVAHAESWEQRQPECVLRVEHAYHCTSACVNRLWPLIARCANAEHAVDPEKLEQCMQPIYRARYVDRTPELVGDPVAEAFSCAQN